MKTIEQIQNDINKKLCRRKEIFEIKEPLDAELLRLGNQLEKLSDQLTEAKLSTEMSFDDKFTFLMEVDETVGGKQKYEEASKMALELGFFMGGYYPHSNQRALQVMLDKKDNKSVEKTYESFQKILHLIKPNNEKGEKVFDIFEHSLSADGSYDLVLTEHQWELRKTRYSRVYVVESWENLLDALYYIQEHHYYSGGDDDEDYD